MQSGLGKNNSFNVCIWKKQKVSENNPVGFTRSEVAEKLAPAISLHGIQVQDDYIQFPGISPTVGVPESQLTEMDAPVTLPFKDIASITPFNAHIEVLLYSGKLYTFSIMDTVKTHINTYTNSENTKSEKSITVQEIAGNIWDSLEKTLSSEEKKTE